MTHKVLHTQPRLGKTIDYNDTKGATSAYMTAVDSVTRHGKIWFQESDQRTFVNGSADGGWLPNLRTLEDIFQVHRREVGMSMVQAKRPVGYGLDVKRMAA